MKQAWEAVHTVDDYLNTACDRGWRPSGCIADYDGQPHHCRLLNLDCERWDAERDRFELTPVSPEAVRWAQEVAAIGRRYILAWHAGAAPDDPDEARVLPEDRARRDALEQRFAAELAANKHRSFVARGQFGPGLRRVRWRSVESDSPAEHPYGLESQEAAPRNGTE